MTGLLGAPRAWLESSPTRWYLVFTDAAVRHWWDRVFRTPPGFGHVYALRWDGWNWLLFNPHVSFTDVQIVAAIDEGQLWDLVPAGAQVVEVEAFRAPDRIRGRWWVGPMTCVEQVKALLGIPVGRIFTPWQLFRYLTGDNRGPQAICPNPSPHAIDQAHAVGPVDHGRPRAQRGRAGESPLGKGQPWRGCPGGRIRTRRRQRP